MARRLDSGWLSGGICKLRELIDEHTAPLAYDFRKEFQLSIFDIGGSISWLEAILLVSVLLQNTNSWTQAAMSKWSYPVTREWVVQAHTFDLLASVNSGKKKPKPYPAPWPDPSTNKIGSTQQRSDADVRRLLRMMNPEGD